MQLVINFHFTAGYQLAEWLSSLHHFSASFESFFTSLSIIDLDNKKIVLASLICYKDCRWCLCQ